MERGSRVLFFIAGAACAPLLACGGGGALGDGADAGIVAPAPDLASPPDLGPPPERLIDATYSIPPSKEFYLCQRKTLREDLLIRTIIPGNNPGLHHLVLAVDPTGKPDGQSPCGPLDPKWTPLFASGVNSPALAMPDGVALRVPAGKQIVLDLHLFNAGTKQPIEGTGSIDFYRARAEDVRQEAEVVLAGPVLFTVPKGDNQVVTGGCRMTGDTNFFAVFPHMHQLGRHIRVFASIGGMRQAVYDHAYRFDEQDFASFAPIPMRTGDRIDVECTYDNATGAPVKFGDSSTEEMCFAISYRYPKLGVSFGGICPF